MKSAAKLGVAVAIILASLVIGAILREPAPGNGLSVSDRVLTVHTPAWPGDTATDMTGFYWDTLRAVYLPAGMEIRPTFTSYADSIRDVQQHRCDIGLSTYRDEYDGVIYPNWALEVEQPIVVFRPEQAYREAGDLDGRRVAWIRAYAFDQYLPVDLELVEVESLAEGLELLRQGLIDYLIDYSEHFSRAGVVSLRGLGSRPVEELARAVYPMFRDDERGRELARYYDERMGEMFADGTLYRLYARYGRGSPMVPRNL